MAGGYYKRERGSPPSLIWLGTGLTRRVLDHVLGQKTTTRDPNAAFERQLSFGQRLADRAASFGGSWTFMVLFAALQAPVIMMSQNRQVAKDRLDARAQR